MKIIQVLYYPGQGGAEQYAYLLAKEAINLGHEVSFIFGAQGPLSERVKELNPKAVHYIKMRSPFDPLAVLTLYKLFKKEKPDIILTHFLRENFLSIVAGRLAGVKGIFSTNHRLEKRTFLQRLFNRIYSRALSSFIAVSPLSVDYLKAEGIKEGKIVLIPNGVEVGKVDKTKIRHSIGVKESEKTISYVGRFTSEKRHTLLIDAFYDVDYKYRMVLVGEGILLSRTKNYAFEKDLSERIVFTGGLDRGYEIIGASDLYVQPSDIENAPLSVMEAMLLGVPIVASDISAHKLILKDGRFGRLFKKGNSLDLARKIEEAFRDNEGSQKMAKEAQEFATEHYTARKMTEKTLKLFEEYIQK